MPTPKVTCTSPIAVTLKKETRYSFCTCGHTQKSPFCDGVHKEIAPEFKSLKFEVEEDGEYWLCQCKQTKTPPFCDGAHKNI